MKSSTGEYYQGLDHVRAVAVFLVFGWHFVHFNGGETAPPLAFPLSFLTEGHTGVSIFMALSGYLFAKLLNGRQIIFSAFLFNRFLRLAPLLILVILLVPLNEWRIGNYDPGYWSSLPRGLLLPGFPNGGWSITVEAHFYLLLPLLLLLACRSKYLLLLCVLLAVVARFLMQNQVTDLPDLVQRTLVGRFDQFVLGIFAFQIRDVFKGRGHIAMLIGVAFCAYWYWFDANGGLYNTPRDSLLWCYALTIEGGAYAALIAWYDGWFTHSDRWYSRFFAAIGTYSYSIYLLHEFVVWNLPVKIDRDLFRIDGPYELLIVMVPCFLLMVPVGYLGYHLIEMPFLKFRRRYLRPLHAPVPLNAAQATTPASFGGG